MGLVGEQFFADAVHLLIVKALSAALGIPGLKPTADLGVCQFLERERECVTNQRPDGGLASGVWLKLAWRYRPACWFAV